MGGYRSSSSGEEDGDANWKAAIASVATTASSIEHKPNGTATTNGDEHKPKIKLYQIKAQKLLEDIIEKTIEVVKDTAPTSELDPPVLNDGGVRLFKHAPRGIVFDHVDELHGPSKKPKILRREELDEKSTKFRKQLQLAAVDGNDIIASAKVACDKSKAKVEARESAAKLKAKREEERIAELKKIRGERWLPSIAREMQPEKAPTAESSGSDPSLQPPMIKKRKR